MLFHVSEHGGIERFELRRADESCEPRVWAIDDDRLRNYLVPRDCPRVTYYAGANTSPSDVERFLGASHAVIAFEHAWLARVRSTRLFCYQLPPEGFELADACAGYFVSRHSVKPLSVRVVDDCLSELVSRGVEVRVLLNLWDLHDAVARSTLAYSMIRMRNATPRPDNLRGIDHKSMAATGRGPGLRRLSALRAGQGAQGIDAYESAPMVRRQKKAAKEQ